MRLNKILPFALLLSLAACNNESADNTGNSGNTGTTNTPSNIPTPIQYQMLNEFPHDTRAFTEGLEYHDGMLYEGTGEYGTSDLRKVDLKTGKATATVKLSDKYFGEGITVLNGKIYQLTYREKVGFVYDAKTLKKEKEFMINTAEGWGMTNDGTNLIYDDGGSQLHYLDPATLKEVKTLSVTDENGAVDNINELEFIKGFIYANVWQQEIIIKIDPATGRVVGRADLSDLRQKTGIAPAGAEGRSGPDVLNGIAYDAAGNRIFITGKYWPKLFEIRLDN